MKWLCGSLALLITVGCTGTIPENQYDEIITEDIARTLEDPEYTNLFLNNILEEIIDYKDINDFWIVGYKDTNDLRIVGDDCEDTSYSYKRNFSFEDDTLNATFWTNSSEIREWNASNILPEYIEFYGDIQRGYNYIIHFEYVVVAGEHKGLILTREFLDEHREYDNRYEEYIITGTSDINLFLYSLYTILSGLEKFTNEYIFEERFLKQEYSFPIRTCKD